MDWRRVGRRPQWPSESTSGVVREEIVTRRDEAHEWADQRDLPWFDDQAHFPDCRVEYEDRHGTRPALRRGRLRRRTTGAGMPPPRHAPASPAIAVAGSPGVMEAAAGVAVPAVDSQRNSSDDRPPHRGTSQTSAHSARGETAAGRVHSEAGGLPVARAAALGRVR